MALVVSFAVDYVAARLLGIEQYGVVASSISLILLVSCVTSAGLPSMVIRIYAEYAAKKEYGLAAAVSAWASRRILLISVTASAILIALALVPLSFTTYFHSSELRVAVTIFTALVIPLQAVSLHYQSVLQAMNRPVLALAGNQFVRPFVYLVVLTVIFLKKGEVNSSIAMAGYLLGAAVMCLFSKYWLSRSAYPKTKSKIEKSDAQRWWNISLPLGLILISSTLMGAADPWFLEVYTRSSEEAAKYNLAFKLSIIIPFALGAINVVIAPRLAELFAIHNLDDMQRLLTWASRFIFLYTVPITIVLWFGSPWILELFGKHKGEFSDSYGPLKWLILGQAFNALCGSVGIILAMTGHQLQAARILVVTVVLKIILNLTLIPMFQATGAAMATAVTMVAWNVCLYIVVRKNLGLEPTIWSYVRGKVQRSST
jgi:O-antigen/teichoic acid export membrane protein